MNCTNPNILLFSEKELFYVGPKGKSRQKVVTQIPEAMELLKVNILSIHNMYS